jgi:hypothetical protein
MVYVEKEAAEIVKEKEAKEREKGNLNLCSCT